VKTFLRKLKLSFRAMLCGWVACNIAWWLGAVFTIDDLEVHRSSILPAIALAVSVGIFTAIVVAVAWLVIFLPVDLLVADDSKLREPKAAAMCGFLAALTVVLLVFVAAAWYPVQNDGFWEGIQATADIRELPYVLASCTTGVVAAICRARLNNRSP
jgi:hypothetical protein